MNVIAKGKGPGNSSLDGYSHLGFGILTKGKSYEVMSRSTQKQFERIEMVYNPSKPEFYIFIIDDRGIESAIWNDYFYSTDEMRELKLEALGI